MPMPVGKAGQLIDTNSSWRTSRPVVNHAQCIMCLQCYLYCPDGAIFEQNEQITIDYDFCKGCGICANECPKQALVMTAEEK